MFLLSIQKTLALLVLPVGALWLLLLLAGFICFRRRQKAMGSCLLTIALLYAAAGNVHLGHALMATLERGIPSQAKGPFDAVLVLGGGSDEDPFGRPQLHLAGDRILLAARLWHQGQARLLVASGLGPGGEKGIRNEGEETRALWRDLGIPDAAILVVQEPCWITRDEIAAYCRLQSHYGWRHLALVSSASHLPRALGLAEKAGLSVTPIGADWRGRSPAIQLQSLVPQAEGFLDTQRACWEYLGRWVGR